MSEQEPTSTVPSAPRGGNRGGPLAWFARNAVAANVIMLVFLIGGFFKLRDVKQEVFPEFTLDMIVINVPYPGASPAEVEQGVVLAVEEAVRGVDGVKEVRSTALEGAGVVTVELLLGTNAEDALAEVKSAIDRITSMPENAERPVVFRAKNRNQVISLVLYGDQPEQVLRVLADRARDDLLLDPKITTVELAGIRPYEISVEIAQDDLRRYGLTLDQVAAIIRQSSVELPGGAIKTTGGEVLVRTDSRRDTAAELEDVIVVSRPDGTTVRLGQIAHIVDGFAEVDTRATFNGKRAVMVNVFRVGEQTPLEISATVKDYVKTHQADLPPGVHFATWFDTSEIYSQRIDLLTHNAMLGLILVLLILGLFLEVKLAFWVTLGIPVSFLGAMIFLPAFDVSLNMISLFAFILVLGMVVDDAIVIGEAVYTKRQQGLGFVEAAVFGVKQMAVPVTFAIATTIVAYTPLLLVPGIMGKFFRQIPIVVISVLIISLIEALLVLPAHLGHSRPAKRGPLAWLDRQQERFGVLLERFIHHIYAPTVRWAVNRRYLTAAICISLLLTTCGVVKGGHLQFTFMPKVEADQIVANVELPFGAPIERTRAVEARMIKAAQEILADSGGDAISRGIYSQTGAPIAWGGPRGNSSIDSGGHLAATAVYLVPIDQRTIGAAEFARRWREKLADVPGIERLSLNFSTGAGGGSAVAIELRHPNNDTLEKAAVLLADRLPELTGVFDIDSGVTGGKPQLDLELKPEARGLGLTELELARQLRASFFGAEATRQQRGRDEVRTYVRLPRAERESEYDFEQMIVRTPSGGELPLDQAAWVKRGRSYTSIQRLNGQRTITVEADVDTKLGNANVINAEIASSVMPALISEVPGLQWTFGGEQKQQKELMGSLAKNGFLALMAMFALLAIVFKSYIQPLIVMSAIPFGFIGAVIGHLVFGYDLSIMSMMGLVALSGVAVNDSLVYVDAINELRGTGLTPLEAAVNAGEQRFRPILLTSLTTFGGLMPMVMETSMQARFLIPMAISLSFGVMFATFTTLLLVPSIYLIINDLHRGVMWLRGKDASDDEAEEIETYSHSS